MERSSPATGQREAGLVCGPESLGFALHVAVYHGGCKEESVRTLWCPRGPCRSSFAASSPLFLFNSLSMGVSNNGFAEADGTCAA